LSSHISQQSKPGPTIANIERAATEEDGKGFVLDLTRYVEQGCTLGCGSLKSRTGLIWRDVDNDVCECVLVDVFPKLDWKT
jgi:hypothetical protein